MNLIIRKASILWKGSDKGGSRTVATGSGVLTWARFSLGTLLTKSSHADPAELIAAAHAASFSMALSNEIGSKASAPGETVTTATVTLENLAAGWTIMNIHLNLTARLPKLTQNKFIDAVVRAKTSCLVSRSMRANISMSARLEK